MTAEPSSHQPPWTAFPGGQPDEVFWKQGNAEPFMLSFFAFWDTLSDDQKQTYFKHWEVPEPWLTYLEPGGVRDELAAIDREDQSAS